MLEERYSVDQDDFGRGIEETWKDRSSKRTPQVNRVVVGWRMGESVIHWNEHMTRSICGTIHVISLCRI